MTNISADALIYMLYGDPGMGGLFPNPPETPGDAAGMLAAEFDKMLDGTALGAVLLNTNYQISYIPCTTEDTAWMRQNGEPITAETFAENDHWTKYFTIAHEHGIEPFALAAEQVRRHGAEVWFSIRVNDFHYLNIPSAVSSFWSEHPELRCSPKGVFDYTHREAREHRIRYIAELCSLYDIDGIECDMIRGDRFFADDSPLSPEEKKKCLTEFFAELRAAMDAASGAAGRRRPHLAVRVYSDIAEDEKRYFDPGAWIACGAVDKLIVSNFFMPGDFDIPFEAWREKLRAAGAERYSLIAGTDHVVRCVSWRHPMERNVRLDTALLCGFASGAYHRGADGIYLFNRFLMEKELDFAAFTDRELCMQSARRYVRTYKDPGADTPMPWELCPDIPVSTSLETAAVPRRSAFLLIGIDQKEHAPEIRFNGTVLEAPETVTESVPHPEPVPCWLCYAIPLSVMKEGRQDLELTAKTGTVSVLWLEVTADSL